MTWRETQRERLLQYRSVTEWKDKESAPNLLTEIADDPADQELYFEQWRTLYGHLWDIHVASLPAETQLLLKTGEHPAYQEDRWDLAEPYRLQLDQRLQSIRKKCVVSHGNYHGEQCFNVRLESSPAREDFYNLLPEFFMGFKVFYLNCDQLTHD